MSLCYGHWVKISMSKMGKNFWETDAIAVDSKIIPISKITIPCINL